MTVVLICYDKAIMFSLEMYLISPDYAKIAISVTSANLIPMALSNKLQGMM